MTPSEREAALVRSREDARLIREFGDSIRYYREHSRMSQAELARRSFVSRQNICMVEKGRQGVTITTLYRLAKALSLHAGDLLP